MKIPTYAAVACAALFCCVSFGPTQEKKLPPLGEEDLRLTRMIESWLELNESEHDHVYREVMRGSDKKVEDDFEQWFVRLGGDEDGWDRTRIQRKSVTEIFDRVARQMEVRGPVLTREQFIDYAKGHWPPEKSTVWREPPPFDAFQEGDRLFKRLDVDRDGYLSFSEMAPTLRAELKRWDRNEDRWIGPGEYLPYFAQRLDRAYREAQQRADKPFPPLEIRIVDEAQRLAVPRAGQLPLGLPAWFEQVDTDLDGQIALFEWRAAGWPLDDFTRIDSNDDGYLETQEVLKLLAVTDRVGGRPFAYLLQMRPESARAKTKANEKKKR